MTWPEAFAIVFGPLGGLIGLGWCFRLAMSWVGSTSVYDSDDEDDDDDSDEDDTRCACHNGSGTGSTEGVASRAGSG